MKHILQGQIPLRTWGSPCYPKKKNLDLLGIYLYLAISNNKYCTTQSNFVVEN